MDKSNSFVCLKFTLISVNFCGIAIGIAGFITGLVKPDLLIENGVSGAQLALVSIFLIFISFIGFIGALRDHYHLLMIYGILILVSFALRILWLTTSYWHRGETFVFDANVATSIMSVILKLLIMVFAFLQAHAIRSTTPDSKLKYINAKNSA